jgi:Family of unknown function (DUF6314)
VRLADFEGDWLVERQIDDRRAGRSGRFVGRAAFTPAPGGLAYREEGTLTLRGEPGYVATRSYLWRDGGGDMIEVWFADGRFFHRFAGDEASPGAEHMCPPDRYLVQYDFARWPRWQAAWRVNGPRKDYAIVSRFSPNGRAG